MACAVSSRNIIFVRVYLPNVQAMEEFTVKSFMIPDCTTYTIDVGHNFHFDDRNC